MSKRASIFEESGDLDLSGFAPKVAPDTKAPPAEQVRAVSESANFPSREPKRAKAEPAKVEPLKREPRRYRTGRNVQFNVKASHATVEAFYHVCDKMGWVLGETLEHAIVALQRELKISK